jgi:SAM-dependent methyltransferase
MNSYDLFSDEYQRSRIRHQDVASLLTEVGFDKSGNVILDLGAGDLRETAHLSGSAELMTAADISISMLSKIHLDSVHRVCCDFDRQLPFGDRVFSHIAMISSIHHASDKRRLLGELQQILSTGGRFLAITNSPEQVRGRWTYQFFGNLAELNAARFLDLDRACDLFLAMGFELEIRPLRRPPLKVDASFLKRLETRIFDSAFFLINDRDWKNGLNLARNAIKCGCGAMYERDRVAFIARKL